ncbi:MAG: response regulator [Saprospiraceae bacterium]
MDYERTLLIVDDEVDVCMLLRRALLKQFQKVECAHSLTEGYALAATFQPDVVLLDNNLPDGYGLEHIAEFKHADKPTRVVMISAMDIRQEAIAAGADEFMGKPVDVKMLKAIA